MSHELASEIRLFAKMIEQFHGEYAYQGWVHTMRKWAERVDNLAAPDRVWTLLQVNYEGDNDIENLSSIHATKARAEEEVLREWGKDSPEIRIEAWTVHQ